MAVRRCSRLPDNVFLHLRLMRSLIRCVRRGSRRHAPIAGWSSCGSIGAGSIGRCCADDYAIGQRGCLLIARTILSIATNCCLLHMAPWLMPTPMGFAMSIAHPGSPVALLRSLPLHYVVRFPGWGWLWSLLY